MENKNLTIAEQIIKYLESGFFVGVKRIDSDGETNMVFSPNKDAKGNYRTSMWDCSLENARNTTGDNGTDEGYSMSEMKSMCKEEDWKIIDKFLQPFKPYEVGQKVKYFKDIKIATGKIKRIADNGYYAIDTDLIDVIFEQVRHHFELEPVFEEEEEETIEIDGKKWSKSTIKEALKQHAQ